MVGAYGHGLSRLKMYCDRLNKKIINPKSKIKIKKISPSIFHIDANDSIGFVAADLGMKKTIETAKKTGIALVAIKNSGHYGLSGYYAEQAVKKKSYNHDIHKCSTSGRTTWSFKKFIWDKSYLFWVSNRLKNHLYLIHLFL